MGQHIEKAIRAKRPIQWPSRDGTAPCGRCGYRPGHAPWWKSTPPPSCDERVLKYG